MKQPGWYTDPAGTPDSARWWDGQQWTPHVRSLGQTTPPPEPGRRLAPILFGVGVLVLVGAILAAVLLWPRAQTPGPDPSAAPTPGVGSPGPAYTPGPNSPYEPGAAPDCMSGNRGSTDASAAQYRSTGIAYRPAQGWGFRYDKTQWTWLSDQAVWGDSATASGVALGGVAKGAGFAVQDQVAEGLVGCMVTHGFWTEDPSAQVEVVDPAQTMTVDGMASVRTLLRVTSDEPESDYDVLVHVIDSGRPDSWAVWIGFWPQDVFEAQAAIEQAATTITSTG